ncbi:unnamed protein product [Bursaphelenchus okinawaensis]|uniref:Vacuolar protein sorting-associated protein 33B n=1 Tax=Bursaphelenchus okinawaensis TaxID=465554 RepID=A0A811LMM4_9BILA|nr:unnamed protein product [Bursaphelenchus okinawaensis]CAG9125393.1 unnamed protein product [Bursaphelenchus okinawaensis]
MDDMGDFSLIVQLSHRELIHVLESIPGQKDLVVESTLMRPLDKIASMSLLIEHGVPRVQQLKAEGTISWDPNLPERVFLCRPTLANMRKISEYIRADPTRTYHMVLVDRKRSVCEIELEKYGVYGQVYFHELNLYVVPLESDVFSLELPEPSLKSTNSALPSMARALWQLQCLYGLIPVSYNFGKQAKCLEHCLKQIFFEQGEPTASADRPISHMIVFDRSLDIASVLLTGLTYESMLNDCFQYSCGKIIFGEAVENKLKNKNNLKSKAYSLNNSDAIFSAIRNKHMTSVFPFLSTKAKTLQCSYDKASAMSKVDEVKSFVVNELKSLREQHKLLEVHICACETMLEINKGCTERLAMEHSIVKGQFEATEVMNYIENLICRQYNPWQVLQLMCLWSVTSNGIPVRHFSSFRTLFLHAYGYEHLTTLFYLNSAGLLTEAASANTMAITQRAKVAQSDFGHVLKTLELVPKPGSKQKIEASYVFSEAYTPVVLKILELLVDEGWDSQTLKKAFKDVYTNCSSPTTPKPDNRIMRAILVCFPGGVTYSEIAALRRFAQDKNFRIIIITSHIISRERFLKGFTDQ